MCYESQVRTPLASMPVVMNQTSTSIIGVPWTCHVNWIYSVMLAPRKILKGVLSRQPYQLTLSALPDVPCIAREGGEVSTSLQDCDY